MTDAGIELTGPALATEPILAVRDLDIDFWVDGTWYPAVKNAEFDLLPGEVLAIVGESGSGKSTTAMAIMGLLPKNAHVSGSILLGDRQLVGASTRFYGRIRGKEAAVIFQEPMTALNPVYTIGFQIMEMLRTHQAMAPSAARKRAIELLTLVEIPEPERRVDSYPHQLSGGQRQRAMIAQALALDPRLLIADEPTTALDVTVQAEILKLMRDLKDRISASIILITHDMGVVADMADRILVMKNGEILESGSADKIFHHPEQPYTQELLDAVPHLGAVVAAEGVEIAAHLDEELGLVDIPTATDGAVAAEPVDAGAAPGAAVVPPEAADADVSAAAETAVAPRPQPAVITHVDDGEVDPTKRAGPPEGVPLVVDLKAINVEYPKRGRVPAFRAVSDFDLSIAAGEVVGLVGESGSGKTTIGRAIVGLLPFVGDGTADVVGTDMAKPNKEGLRKVRNDVSFVFQDPGSSLNPRLPVGESIGEPMLLHKVSKGRKDLSNRVEALLDQVQLPRALRNRYPHELSGGQRQRIGIARALALSPKLLIADEPTSALDVSVQARVLDLFQELQREQGFACMFISHDLAVVEILSRRIVVLHHGRLVEMGTREQILSHPIDDYTKRLLAAVPVPDPQEQAERRRQRDKLLAAGVGVDDEYEVFSS